MEMNLINAFWVFMNVLVKHTLANKEQSKFSIVLRQSIVNTESKFSDGLVRSAIACSSKCLEHPKCLLGHYHPFSKRCALYCTNTLVSNTTEDGMILIIESRKNVDDCSATCGTGVFDIKKVGPVFCENTKHGGGWTVFQRRFDGSVDFYRNWENYKHGFGDMNGGEFWLGLEKLHKLTYSGQYILRVDLSDFENNTAQAIYSNFKIGDESTGYQLNISGYSGDAGESMIQVENGMKFSTFDRDNDVKAGSCAQTYKGAWWYEQCHHSNLNGLYLGGPHETFANGVNWKDWKGQYYSLKSTEMMIRKL